MNISNVSLVNFNGKTPNGFRQMVISGPKAGQKLICRYKGDPANNLTALGYDFIETNNGVRNTLDSINVSNKDGLGAESIAEICEKMEKHLEDAYDMIAALYQHAKRPIA